MKDNYTHLVLVADRSGSMNGIHTDINGAIRKMMEDQAKEPGDITVDVIVFDDKIDVVYESVDPLDVSDEVIVPRGWTALNDALGMAIARTGRKISAMTEENRPSKVIVVVATDGMENASHEYSHEQIKAMVEEQTSKWNWTFMYMAANVDAFATGKAYGFAPGQTISFAASGAGGQSVYAATSSNITRTRSGLDTGYLPEERDAAQEK